MTLAAAKDRTQSANRAWVCVDTSVTDATGPYSVNGNPMVELEHTTMLPDVYGELRLQRVPRMFWRTKKDVLAAINSLDTIGLPR